MTREKELKGIIKHPMASAEAYKMWKSSDVTKSWASARPAQLSKKTKTKNYGAFRLKPLRRSKAPKRY